MPRKKSRRKPTTGRESEGKSTHEAQPEPLNLELSPPVGPLTSPHDEPQELKLPQADRQEELTPTQQLAQEDAQEEELTPTQRLVSDPDTEEEEEELTPTQRLLQSDSEEEVTTQSDTQPDTQPVTSTSVLEAALPPRTAGSMTLRPKPRKKATSD